MADVETLKDRIYEWAVKAPEHRASIDQFRMILSMKHLTLQARTRLFEQSMGAATVKLGLAEIDQLSDPEFERFKATVATALASAIMAEEGTMFQSLEKGIALNSPYNIVDHERQHTDPLPDAIRTNAIIYFTLVEHLGDIALAGANIVQGGSHVVHAISSSEPRFLTTTDAQSALEHARATGSRDFVDIVAGRILRRERFSWPDSTKRDWADILK